MSDIQYDPSFWLPHHLSEDDIKEICTRQMKYQAAKGMADTLMDDMDYEKPPQDSRDLIINKLIGDCCALICHVGAIDPRYKKEGGG